MVECVVAPDKVIRAHGDGVFQSMQDQLPKMHAIFSVTRNLPQELDGMILTMDLNFG